jgi:hypothetical protein
MVYASNDIRVLKALLRGVAPTVSSAHRVRLEMLGLIADGAEGLRITPKENVLPAPRPFVRRLSLRPRANGWRRSAAGAHPKQIGAATSRTVEKAVET